MIRILHSADNHLGLENRLIPVRRRERMQSFFTMMEYVQNEKLDLVLLAGDFLETATVSKDETALIRQALEDVQIPVFIAPGNHDYYTIDSAYYEEQWPSNVHIFTHPKRIDFADLRVSVFGAGFLSTYQHEPLLQELSRLEKIPGFLNLCVLHGDPVSRGKNSKYNPIWEEDIAESGFDYLALGHIHTPFQGMAGKVPYAYSGSPDGGGFGEPGKRGAYVVTFDQGRMQTTSVHFQTREYITEKIDITDLSIPELESLLREHMKAPNNLYRFRLRGVQERHSASPADYLVSRLKRNAFYLEILDESMPGYNFEKIRHEKTLLGRYVDTLMRALDEAKDNKKQRKIIEKALLFGALAYDGKEMPVDFS